MPQNYKVLGQVAPGAATLADLYVVPSSTETVISSIVVANRSASTVGTYRIAITPNGATLGNVHYLMFDVPLNPADSTTITLGLTVDSADKVLVQASTADFSFSAFGVEFS
jgi:hypothetical protein